MLSDNWRFKDRLQAGQKLGERLLIRSFSSPVILALSKGGVLVADEVARILGAPMDFVIVRKIGAPKHEEFIIGAISEDEVPHFDLRLTNIDMITGAEIKAVIKLQTEELRRRIAYYRGGRELPDLERKTVILIDDGLATGVSAAAVGAFLRTYSPKELILAVPVCPQEISSEVGDGYDGIICLQSPSHFQAVGSWYEHFHRVEDDEVRQILNRHHLNATIPHDHLSSNSTEI
jgi:putative phosphoribosyl transferase